MKSLNKKGMELAANTIVILIVSVVIFISALGLTYNVLCSAEEYAATVDKNSQAQINRLFTTGGKVVVADNTKVAKTQGSMLCGSSRDKTATFVVGIKNTLTDSQSFIITVKDQNGNIASDEEIVFFPGQGQLTEILAPGETQAITILAILPNNERSRDYQVMVEQGRTTYGVQSLYLSSE